MELGRISAIFRYPVKSMAGESLDVARLSWHGIEGDRRLAFRRLTDKSGFPWLTASKLPQLLLYKPFGRDSNANSKNGELLPTHVRTPDGKEYELRSDELRKEVSSRYGSDVELMNLKTWHLRRVSDFGNQSRHGALGRARIRPRRGPLRPAQISTKRCDRNK